MPTYRIEVETTSRHYVTTDACSVEDAEALALSGNVSPECISDLIRVDVQPVGRWVRVDEPE